MGELLQAQISMSEWQFLPAIIALQAVDGKLNQWKGVVPLGNQVHDAQCHVTQPMAACFFNLMQDEPNRRQIQKSIRSPAESPPPRSSVPYLYKWMCKVHVTLLAKVGIV